MTSRSRELARASRRGSEREPPSSAAAPPRQKTWPKTLAARRTRRASASSALEARLRPSPARSRAARRPCPRRRRGSAPRGRTRCRRRARRAAPTIVVVARRAEHLRGRAARSPCAARLAEAELGARPRSRPEVGEELVDLGPREREHEERPIRAERAERRVDELARSGRSPQCRSSSTSRTGCAAASAATKSSQARRIWSPMSMRVSARGAELTLSSSGNGAPMSSPRNSATRAPSSPSRRGAPTRARSLRWRTSIGSPSRMPDGAAERRRDHAERRAGAHGIAAADPDLDPLAARREPREELVAEPRLPKPGRAGDHGHRAPPGSATHSSKSADSAPSSRSRPTHGVGWPSSVRAASPTLALAEEAKAVGVARDLEARVEEAGRELVEPDLPHGPPRAAASATRAIDDIAHGHAAGRRPRARRPAPGPRPEVGPHRERAPRRAGRLIGGGTAGVDRDTSREPFASTSSRPPWRARRASRRACSPAPSAVSGHRRGSTHGALPVSQDDTDHPPLDRGEGRRRRARPAGAVAVRPDRWRAGPPATLAPSRGALVG